MSMSLNKFLFRQIWDQRQGTADIYCTSASPWCPESSRFECLRRAKFIKFSRAPFRIVKGMLQVSWTCFQSEICPLSKFIQPFLVGNSQCWDGELKIGDGHSRVYLHIAGICLRIYCIVYIYIWIYIYIWMYDDI